MRPSPAVATRTISAALLLSLSAAGLGGCYGVGGIGVNGDTDRARRIRGDLTPELETLYQREVDVANMTALTWDENWRMMNQDFNRLMLIDRPSRLAREPIPR